MEHLKTNENENDNDNESEDNKIVTSNVNVISEEKNVSIDERISNSSDEEIKVDYENSSLESVSTVVPIVPQRQLREYSPERRIERIESEKKTCSNFSKFGNCRYGENCRFSHLKPPTMIQKRRPVASRVKLSNLPPSSLNPISLTEIMSEFGSVTNVTVFPEKGEATVQYANGEEALKAVEGTTVESFGVEGVVIELEIIRPQHQNTINRFDKDTSNYNVNKNNTTSSTGSSLKDKIKLKLKLQSLITLQKQQQTLLETNLVSQQSLLTHLRNTSILEEEREELMAALNRIQESLMGIQEMLKRTTELVMETASSIKTEEVEEEQRINAREIAKVRHFDNKRSSHNTFNSSQHLSYNDRKTQTQHQTQIQSRPQYQSNLHYNNYSYNSNNNNIRQYSQATSHTLDLRPVTLKLGPLKETQLNDIHALQRHFSPYGPIQSLIISPEEGGVAVVKYQRHGDALRALEKAGKDLGSGVEFGFMK